MTAIHHEITIDTPVDGVWAVLADLPKVVDYNDTVKSANWKSSIHTGLGAARVCQLRPKGEVTEEVTLWEPNTALGLRVVKSPWPPITSMEWTIRLEADGTRRTIVGQDLAYSIGLGPIGALLNALVVKRKLTKTLDAVFANLKDHVERTTTMLPYPGRLAEPDFDRGV
jgi:uncharacterized membrane protein